MSFEIASSKLDRYLLEAKEHPLTESKPTGGTVTIRLPLIEAGGSSKLGMIEVSGSRKQGMEELNEMA